MQFNIYYRSQANIRNKKYFRSVDFGGFWTATALNSVLYSNTIFALLAFMFTTNEHCNNFINRTLILLLSFSSTSMMMRLQLDIFI